MTDPGAEGLLAQLRRALPPGAFLDRRLGRALAFQALYEMDLAHHAPAEILERLAAGEEAGPPFPPELLAAAGRYAQQLARGVLAQRREIDALIHERAPLWPLAQMSAVDRNILRIGLYESLYSNATVPLRAAINEAVELAKLFGSETSAKFVNGVLGRAVEAAPSGDGARLPATSRGRDPEGHRLHQDSSDRAPGPPAEDAGTPAERGLDNGHEL